MNSQNKKTLFPMYFICLFTAIFLINFSCSKDANILGEVTTNEQVDSVEEQDSTDDNNDSEEEGEQEHSGPDEDSEEDKSSPRECSNSGGYANDTGLKTWCWDSVSVPSGEPGNNSFSNGQLTIAAECNPNLVTKQGSQLRFSLNPTSPTPQSWCRNDFNMRAEISTAPWQVNQPLGTEEWLGWSYTFGDDYKIDNENPWSFFQMQQGVAGSPPHHMGIASSGLYGAEAGEILISNIANKTEDDKVLTGIIPQAGTTLNIVVHVVHDLGSKGQLQIWINEQLVYDKQVSTVHDWAAWGGNAKFGIYKWAWKQEENIQKSLDQGIDHLVTYMGALRIITRRPGDANYGQNSYEIVASE